jgi:hypothetical protein
MFFSGSPSDTAGTTMAEHVTENIRFQQQKRLEAVGRVCQMEARRKESCPREITPQLLWSAKYNTTEPVRRSHKVLDVCMTQNANMDVSFYP